MMMIGGAAVGAFLISNDMAAVKHTLKDMGKVFKCLSVVSNNGTGSGTTRQSANRTNLR